MINRIYIQYVYNSFELLFSGMFQNLQRFRQSFTVYVYYYAIVSISVGKKKVFSNRGLYYIRYGKYSSTENVHENIDKIIKVFTKGLAVLNISVQNKLLNFNSDVNS